MRGLLLLVNQIITMLLLHTDTELLLAWPINENEKIKKAALNGMQIFQMFSQITHCNLWLMVNSINYFY